jgi:hypothetical protein
MSTTKSCADNLRAGCTFSGRPIGDWGGEVKEQNYARRVLDDLKERIYGRGFNLHTKSAQEDALIERVVTGLRANLHNPIHYRGEAPGVFDGPDKQLFPDPRFGYLSLVSFGERGEDGFAGFLQNCDLPLDTPYKTVIAWAAVLAIDDALEEIERELPWRVTWTIYAISEVATEIEEILDDEYLKEERRKVAAEAGRAAHKDTNAFKKEVLQEWAAGRFKSIAACARWACRQFPIEADETPKRWIRAYQKGLLS